MTPELRKKHSIAAKKSGTGKWMKGRKLSPQHIKNRSASLSGKSNGSWKDGRMSDKKYVSWLKNKWHQRIKTAVGSHTFGEWETVKAQYNWSCKNCDKMEPEITLTQDHIIPLSKGGSNNIENIQPLCKKCNSIKSNKIIL